MSAKKFTRIPQPVEFTGVPREAIATYTVLASYANNKTGLCWPKMETLASTLGCSVRTVQRHLHALCEAGMVMLVERRRWRGRFSSYLYRLVHYAQFTTGHRRPSAGRSLYKRRTKRTSNKEKKSKTREEIRETDRQKREASFEGKEWLLN